MIRYLLIFILLTTPCFGQGLGNMGTFGGMGSTQTSFQDYSNSIQNYGDFYQTQGNNPNVYDNYRPQVGDYLKQDPRNFNGYNILMQEKSSISTMRRYNKFNQFDYSLPPY